MLKIKCTFTNGKFQVKSFKGTFEEAQQAFFGKLVTVDESTNNVQRCICVHPA